MATDTKGRFRVLLLGLLVVITLHFLYDFGTFATDLIPDAENVPENWPALSQAALVLLLLAPYIVWLGELVGALWIIRKVRIVSASNIR